MNKCLIIHNILWSRYKADIFSCLNVLAADSKTVGFEFVQIASTEKGRTTLGAVSYTRHNYPYTLLFDGSYEEASKLQLIFKLTKLVFINKCGGVVLPGYHALEHWVALVVALVRGKRIGVFCDSTALDRKKNKFKDFLKILFFSKCDVVFVYGTRGREYVASFGVPYERIVMDCQASILLPDYDAGSALALRSEKGAVAQSNVLYVGRLSEEKGLLNLLDAAEILRESGKAININIVGSGPLHSHLQEEIQTRKLGANVELSGPASPEKLMQLYASSDLLVLPSSVEPWGLVVNEALSYGCPVVASDRCGCVPELIVGGVTGEIFAAGDSLELSRKIDQVLAGRRMGKYVSADCISLVANYSPLAAAKKIFGGVEKIMFKEINQ